MPTLQDIHNLLKILLSTALITDLKVKFKIRKLTRQDLIKLELKSPE